MLSESLDFEFWDHFSWILTLFTFLSLNMYKFNAIFNIYSWFYIENLPCNIVWPCFPFSNSSHTFPTSLSDQLCSFSLSSKQQKQTFQTHETQRYSQKQTNKQNKTNKQKPIGQKVAKMKQNSGEIILISFCFGQLLLNKGLPWSVMVH